MKSVQTEDEHLMYIPIEVLYRPHGDRPCIILHLIAGPHNLPSVHMTHNRTNTDAWMPSQMCCRPHGDQ